MYFEPYPFQKLDTLLADIRPNSDYSPIILTIGEPQFETPNLIQEAFQDASSLLNKYPKSTGEKILKESMQGFVQRRFGVTLKDSQIIPSFGTREVLFNFPQFLLFDKPRPKMVFTNPFYQIYEGAAIASRADVDYLTLKKENAFKPDPNDPALKEADLVILNFPNNPTGSVLSQDELCAWVAASQKYGFVLLNDECYSEIYVDEKPPSLLEAAKAVGNSAFENILVINSISKRSSAPGLRSGFIAGDANILRKYMQYRTYVGCAIPLPLQMAAAKAWSDETHAETIRLQYARNLALASEVLGVDVPQQTFYVWLDVEDDHGFTKRLFERYNVKVLPGSFLGRAGAGGGFVRIALVEEESRTMEALERLKHCMKEG